MWKVVAIFVFAAAVGAQKNDPATHQLTYYKNNLTGPVKTLTTFAGAPVTWEDAVNNVNSNIVDNEYIMDMYQHAARMKVPERLFHAHGSGAFGYFETTHDISHICKADLFSKIGKRTPVAVRFSMGFSRIGVSDTTRDSRGMAVKFYTDEGNFDLSGLNLPVFSFKEPAFLISLAHILSRNPATNLPDNNVVWDWLSHRTEAVNSIVRLFSDYGMPANYAHMESFPIHTYQVYNNKGKSSFVRFRFYPDAGLKYLNLTEVASASSDPDYYARDLYNRIALCQRPTWTLQIQIISEKDAKKNELDIFDTTQELPESKYPYHDVGKLVLLKNPTNHFAEIEQIAFSPGNIVPGVCGSPDKIYQGRRMLYRDGAIHRAGPNFKRIPVNCPLHGANTYSADGAPPVNGNGFNGPNYFPNSFGGFQPYVDKIRPALLKIRESPEPRNYQQASDFYSKKLTSQQRNSLIELMVGHMCYNAQHVKEATVKAFSKINSDLASRVAEGLKAKCEYTPVSVPDCCEP